MAPRQKYNHPTEMLIVRAPAPIHDAIEDRARTDGTSKSEALIATLATALDVPLVRAKKLSRKERRDLKGVFE